MGDGILDWLEEWFKGVLIDGITSNLTGLFDTVNTKVGEIAAVFIVSPTKRDWNHSPSRPPMSIAESRVSRSVTMVVM